VGKEDADQKAGGFRGKGTDWGGRSILRGGRALGEWVSSGGESGNSLSKLTLRERIRKRCNTIPQPEAKAKKPELEKNQKA